MIKSSMTNLVGTSRRFAALLLATTALHSGPAYASQLIARFGPASAGNGGPNPLGIPPGPTDIEIAYVTDGKTEINLAIMPGIFVGKRYEKSGVYASGGPGAVITGNGVGIGGYAAIGYLSEGEIKFNADFKQALGVSGSGTLTSYALRMGVAYDF
jgi:hypothetical protein